MTKKMIHVREPPWGVHKISAGKNTIYFYNGLFFFFNIFSLVSLTSVFFAHCFEDVMRYQFIQISLLIQGR